MIEKINTFKIIRDHIHTLKNYKTGKYSLWDFILFFCVPFLISIALIYFDLLLNKDIVNVLVASLSIFAALLFNLLLLTYDIIKKNSSVEVNPLKVNFLKEIYANISFSVLVAISTVILLLVYFLILQNYCCFLIMEDYHITQFLMGGIYFLVSLFILTLLMVLKRIHILLFKEI